MLREEMQKTGLNVSSSNIGGLIEEVFDSAVDEKPGFVIDEYPYLERAAQGISTRLQGIIDKKSDNSRLFLTLCGSAMPFMHENMIEYEGPFFHRYTGLYHIKPFTFFEAADFLPGTDIDEFARIFGMVDGTAEYLSRMADGAGFEENLKRQFLDNSAYLFNEASFLIKQEMPDYRKYAAMLSTIAGGAENFSEICSKMSGQMNIDRIQCERMLDNLVKLHIIRRDCPVDTRPSKKIIYHFNDCFFRFWYSFISSVTRAINNNRPDTALKYINSKYPDYMGKVFEKICLQWIDLQDEKGNLPIAVEKAGRWWGTDPDWKKETEIDIVAIDFNKDAIFGECKWSVNPVGEDILDALIRKSMLIKDIGARHYYLFSKSGFTEGCVTRARQESNAALIPLSEMEEFSPVF